MKYKVVVVEVYEFTDREDMSSEQEIVTACDELVCDVGLEPVQRITMSAVRVD